MKIERKADGKWIEETFGDNGLSQPADMSVVYSIEDLVYTRADVEELTTLTAVASAIRTGKIQPKCKDGRRRPHYYTDTDLEIVKTLMKEAPPKKVNKVTELQLRVDELEARNVKMLEFIKGLSEAMIHRVKALEEKVGDDGSQK